MTGALDFDGSGFPAFAASDCIVKSLLSAGVNWSMTASPGNPEMLRTFFLVCSVSLRGSLLGVRFSIA